MKVKHQCHEENMRVLIGRVYRDIAENEERLANLTGNTDYDRLNKSLLEKLQFRGDILIFPGDDSMNLARGRPCVTSVEYRMPNFFDHSPDGAEK